MRKQQSKLAPGSAGRSGVGRRDPIGRDLAQLEGLGVVALRDLWSRRFRGAAAPIQSADILRRLVAWKIQVEAFGDLDAETQRRLRDLMRTVGKGQGVVDRMATRLRAGMVLVREWRGREHRALVLDKAFEYGGKRYKSLSQVARAITGTHWSGPRFFGLEGEKSANPKTSGGAP